MNPDNPDLYGALGVDRNADRDSIRKAFRREAAKSHPDKPEGDRERFELVKLADFILSDNNRRAQYDATGSTEQKTELTAILEVVSGAFDSVFQECIRENVEPEHLGMIETLIIHLKGHGEQLADQRKPIDRAIDLHRRMIGRFATEGENSLEAMLRAKITEFEVKLAPIAHRQELVIKATAFVEGYVYRADEPPGKEYPFPFAHAQATGWTFSIDLGR